MCIGRMHACSVFWENMKRGILFWNGELQIVWNSIKTTLILLFFWDLFSSLTKVPFMSLCCRGWAAEEHIPSLAFDFICFAWSQVLGLIAWKIMTFHFCYIHMLDSHKRILTVTCHFFIRWWRSRVSFSDWSIKTIMHFIFHRVDIQLEHDTWRSSSNKKVTRDSQRHLLMVNVQLWIEDQHYMILENRKTKFVN